MKVRDLVEALKNFDGDFDVFCETENEVLIPEGHQFRILEIDSVHCASAEKRVGEDDIPTLRFGRSPRSEDCVIIHIGDE